MTEIATKEQLRARIAQAMNGINALTRAEPSNNWLTSIARQLDYVAGEAQGDKPRLERAADLNFGLLASHYVDDVDSALATELHAIYSATLRLFK